MTVYLLHINGNLHHARHYVGYTADLSRRMSEHVAGRGAKILAACLRQGLSWQLAIVWDGKNRAFERSLKQTHKVSVYCPVCMGDAHRTYTPRSERHAKVKP